MLESFTPQFYIKDVFALPAEALRARGVRGLILDLDNTLTFWHDDHVTPEIMALLREWERDGFKLCLLSNNHGHRVEFMAARLGIDCVKKAGKPFKKGYLQACRQMSLSPAETAMVGDQLLTDMFGANRAGVVSVLVQPMGKREMWGTRVFSRNIEKLIFPRVKKNLRERGISLP